MQRRFLSRRDFLLSGSALAVSGITRGNGCDVIVVGAGAGGIAAARTLRAAGASVLVLEATHSIGGRIRSNSISSPFDRGAHVLSGVSRRQSELHALIARFGISTIAASSVRTGLTRGGDPAFTATYAAMLTAVVERAERIHDGSIPDERAYDAVRAFRDRAAFGEALVHLGIRDDRRKPASLLDYHLVANRAASPFVFPADDTLLVPSGLEHFVVDLAAGVPIVLGAPVASIRYRNGGAVLRTVAGKTYRARKAIVTASTGALASGTIAFSPALPAGIAASITALPMNPANEASYATVGNAGARTALAQPVDGVVRFAGEALAPPGFACLEGAWESGVAAARATLRA